MFEFPTLRFTDPNIQHHGGFGSLNPQVDQDTPLYYRHKKVPIIHFCETYGAVSRRGAPNVLDPRTVPDCSYGQYAAAWCEKLNFSTCWRKTMQADVQCRPLGIL